jgi:effector-binding domain-containing protein
MSKSIPLIAVVGLITVGGAALFAADQKEPARDASAPLVSDSHVQTLRAVTFCHITVKTSIQKMSQTAREGVKKLDKLMAENKIRPEGPPMFVYHGASPDPAAEFTLDMGFVVPDDTKAAGELKVDKLEKFHCMSVLYTGPAPGVSAAYEKVYPDLTKAGHTPTSESREMFLYWEGEDSPNNVIQVSAGIQ